MHELPISYEMEGEGVPLVFIHQVASDHRLWRHQRSYFRPRYRMIAVDVLGHGKVAWPGDALSIECAAMGVQQLLERLNAGPAFFIGVSMGAVVAMRLALRTPAQVLGLVLVSPWDHADEDLRSRIARLFRLAEAQDMAHYMEVFLRHIFPIGYLESHLPEVKRLRTMGLEQNARAVAYAWAACLTVDLRKELGQVRAPSLVIAGLNDLFTPPYLARGVAEGVSEGKLEVWEETGHFPFVEDPARFNRRLEAFIRR